WLGEGGRWGRWAAGVGSDVGYLQRRGFQVTEFNSDDSTRAAPDCLDEINACSARRELHGLFVWAHGYPDLLTNGRVSISYGQLEECLRYRLGFVLLNACMGAFCKHDAQERRDFHPLSPRWGYLDNATARTRPVKRTCPGPAGGYDLVAKG